MNLITIKQASIWATDYLRKNISSSNISYLVQYGKVKKYGTNGTTFIDQEELIKYYESYYIDRKSAWSEDVGSDLDWHLSFDRLTETETTKHIHRIHPYKGKFIPQLVEYFLDAHTDEFKKEVYFKEGDIILDVFSGSGTTLVQANELGMHAIGIDISAFNALLGNVKVGWYDFLDIYTESQNISRALKKFVADSKTIEFENELGEKLSSYNNIHFPVPEYKYKVKRKEIDEKSYSKEKTEAFLPVYEELIKKYEIELRQESANSFLDKWFLKHVRTEIDFLFDLIQKVGNPGTRKVLGIILSRTVRSCRATTHADLATLKEPILSTYYCSKHGKICKPLFSIVGWWERYSKDTLKRLQEFQKIRTKTYQYCLAGDSRTIDIVGELKEKFPAFADLVQTQKIKGIFSSPPYVGIIDYHEQHAYAYDLFKFERNDNLEIGPLSKGQGREARESYVQGIADVLNNSKRFLAEDYDIFLVSNDKYNLYPLIAEKAGMQIVQQFKRPVLHRTELDNAYSESIFHFKSKI